MVISDSEIEKEILIPANWPSNPKAKLGERASVLLAWREVKFANVSRGFYEELSRVVQVIFLKVRVASVPVCEEEIGCRAESAESVECAEPHK